MDFVDGVDVVDRHGRTGTDTDELRNFEKLCVWLIVVVQSGRFADSIRRMGDTVTNTSLGSDMLEGAAAGNTADSTEKQSAGDRAAASSTVEEIDISKATPEQKTARIAAIATERTELTAKLTAAKTDDEKKAAQTALDELGDEEFSINETLKAATTGDDTVKAELDTVKASLAALEAERDALKARLTDAAATGDTGDKFWTSATEEEIGAHRREVKKFVGELEAFLDTGDETFTYNGVEYTAAQVRSTVRGYRSRLEEVPDMIAAAQKRANAETAARTAYPTFFQVGHADNAAVKTLEAELPWLKSAPTRWQTAAEIIAGRKAIAALKTAGKTQATEKRQFKPKTTMRVVTAGGGKTQATTDKKEAPRSLAEAMLEEG